MKNENKINEEKIKFLTDGAKKCLLITEKGILVMGKQSEVLTLLNMMITELKESLPMDILEDCLKMGLMSNEEKLRFMADKLEKIIKDGE